MYPKFSPINVTKASGIKAPFEKQKLKRSLIKSGAGSEQADAIVDEIMGKLVEGMSTKEIYETAFRMLRNLSAPVAARYKLKQSLFQLGPSGFPFEQFIGELLKVEGNRVNVNVIEKGRCVNHEIDVIAEIDNQRFLIECKFHNRAGYICDVKIPLYIQSRFLDVEKEWKIKDHSKTYQAWVVTNTRFSDDAVQYGRCMNMYLLGWDFPQSNGLKDRIDRSGLHPVTSLTSLTAHEKQALLEKKIVLCKTLAEKYDALAQIGIREPRLSAVIQECTALCKAVLHNE